mmetsp:Transcript_259/g.813  ORF Transcript_259/g.813 Transcript_259/m.813 type:complete len:551 (-) Transcript_259:1795-3447(-)
MSTSLFSTPAPPEPPTAPTPSPEPFIDLATDSLAETATKIGLQVLGAFIVAVIGYILVRVVLWIERRILMNRGRKLSESTKGFIMTVSKFTLVVLLIFTVIDTAGISIWSASALFVAFGVGLGSSVSSLVSSLLAGLVLVVQEPFVAGHLITCNSAEGVVSTIGITHTKLRTADGKWIFVPNSILTNEVVTNLQYATRIRVKVEIRIPHEVSVETVRRIMFGIIVRDERVIRDDDDYPPAVVVTGVERDCLLVSMRCWVDKDDYWATLFDMNEAVVTELQRLNVPMGIQRYQIQKLPAASHMPETPDLSEEERNRVNQATLTLKESHEAVHDDLVRRGHLDRLEQWKEWIKHKVSRRSKGSRSQKGKGSDGSNDDLDSSVHIWGRPGRSAKNVSERIRGSVRSLSPAAHRRTRSEALAKLEAKAQMAVEHEAEQLHEAKRAKEAERILSEHDEDGNVHMLSRTATRSREPRTRSKDRTRGKKGKKGRGGAKAKAESESGDDDSDADDDNGVDVEDERDDDDSSDGSSSADESSSDEAGATSDASSKQRRT